MDQRKTKYIVWLIIFLPNDLGGSILFPTLLYGLVDRYAYYSTKDFRNRLVEITTLVHPLPQYFNNCFGLVPQKMPRCILVGICHFWFFPTPAPSTHASLPPCIPQMSQNGRSAGSNPGGEWKTSWTQEWPHFFLVSSFYCYLVKGG